MPKISTYATAGPALSDKLIGTEDNQGKDTKNFYVSDVLQLGSQYFAPNDFGSFYDVTTQTVSVNNIAAMKFSNTVYSNNVSMQSDGSEYTQITFQNAGTYNIQFSAQIERLSGGGDVNVVIWLRVNGQDVQHTATKMTLKSGSSFAVASWNFFQQVSAGDYAQIMWTQSGNVVLHYDSANITIPYPEVPSVILTVNRIQ